MVVEAHNRLRQRLGAGIVSGQPRAVNMRRMVIYSTGVKLEQNRQVWDEELAKIARIWAEQCHIGHDSFRDVGQ